MTISKRVLNNWRKEALTVDLDSGEYVHKGQSFYCKISAYKELNSRILKLTQELIDQQLIKEHKEKQNVS